MVKSMKNVDNVSKKIQLSVKNKAHLGISLDGDADQMVNVR